MKRIAFRNGDMIFVLLICALPHLREEFPDVPVLALTASATPEVQKDICDKLNLKQKIFSVNHLKDQIFLIVFLKLIPRSIK